MEIVVDNGKIVEPSTVKKAMAAMKSDTKAVVHLPLIQVQEILAHKLWGESQWLSKYKSCAVEVEGDGMKMTFSTKSTTK